MAKRSFTDIVCDRCSKNMEQIPVGKEPTIKGSGATFNVVGPDGEKCSYTFDFICADCALRVADLAHAFMGMASKEKSGCNFHKALDVDPASRRRRDRAAKPEAAPEAEKAQPAPTPDERPPIL